MTTLRIKINDQWYSVEIGDLTKSPIEVYVDGEPVNVEVDLGSDVGGGSGRRPRPRTPMGGIAGANSGSTETSITAPMPGRIVRVSVTEGQIVEAGDEVCVLETMKMEQSIHTPQAGVIKAVKVEPGQSVAANDILVELE